MNKKIISIKVILPILLLVLLSSAKKDKPAYLLYNSKGKASDFENLVKAANDADIILFGELHNNPICHWLQLELTKSLYENKKDKLVLGAEMYEADNQLLLTEYTSGKITKKNFRTQARLWPNNETDYQPLLDFAKDNNLHFIATNIPRRYASIVAKNGFEGLDSLCDEAKKFIAPLPVKYDPELPGYKSMIEMMGGMGHGANNNLPKAQAIKDATMAHFILKNFDKEKCFIHFNGTYHSDNFEGITWYLKQQKPDIKIVTISSIEKEDINSISEEDQKLADFILVTPESMTKTN